MQIKYFKKVLLPTVLTITVFFSACGKEGASTTSASASVSTSKPSVSLSDSKEEPETILNYELKLWTAWSINSEYQSLIDGYNRNYPDQAVEVTDLSSEESGFYTLEKSILSGVGPDLVIAPYQLKNVLNERGLLISFDEAISPYLKAYLISGVVECGSIDGSLYMLPAYIREVESCITSDSLYSGKTWRLRDILDCMGNHPELGRTFVYETRKTSITYDGVRYTPDVWYNPLTIAEVFKYDLSDPEFIDVTNKKANFYNAEIVRLLENMARDKESNVKSTDSSLKDAYLAEYFEASDLSTLINKLKLCYNGYNLVGMPREQGAGNLITAESSVGICKNCTNKEAVADFINYIISPEAQLSMKHSFFMSELSWPEVLPIRKDIAPYLVDYEYFKIDDPERFIKAYEEYANNCGMLDLQVIVLRIIEEDILPYLEALGDPNPVAKQIQDKVQEYLDNMED